MSYSSRPHGLQPTRLLRPWDFPGKSTGVGCHCLLLVHGAVVDYSPGMQVKRLWLVVQWLSHVCLFATPWTTPGPSVHGVLQAIILEWVAISFSRGSSQARDRIHISCTGGWILYHWAIRKALKGFDYLFVKLRASVFFEKHELSCFLRKISMNIDLKAGLKVELSSAIKMLINSRMTCTQSFGSARMESYLVSGCAHSSRLT